MIVKIPEDIYAYENKAIGTLTKRQLICLTLGGAVILPSFLLLYWLTGNVDLPGILSAMLGFPILACGFIKKDGVYLEKQMKIKWEKTHRYKTKRPFVMHNFYEDMQLIQKEDLLTYENIPKVEKPPAKHKAPSAPVEKKKHGAGKYSLRNNIR